MEPPKPILGDQESHRSTINTTTLPTGAEEVTWDLTDLYAAGDDPAIDRDLDGADAAADGLEAFLAGNGAIDQYLADQLLLPLAFASGESRFRTAQVTQHLLTNAEVIRAFGAAEIESQGEIGRAGLVRVTPRRNIGQSLPQTTWP